MATTTNYGWTTPDDTALVKDGAAAIRSLGTSIDTTTKALNPSTTLGDIEYRSSTANTNTRLALGTAGQVLTVNSGATAPEWATSASGGMTLISTTSLTGASVTLSSIAATYNNLQLIVQDYLPATDGQRLVMRFNGDSGANYYSKRSTETVAGTAFSDNYAIISETQDNAVTQSLCVIDIPNYANTVTWKIANTVGITVDTTTTTSGRIGSWTAAYNQTGAINSITLFPLSGNFTSGTVLLYGVK
jgi:hypothetical protein